MEKKRILLVHNFYQIGGGEHVVFENEKNMLQENGHAVFTYTRSNEELKKNKWKLLLTPFTTSWSFQTFRQVRRQIREHNIHVVHCHNTFPLISPAVYYAARSLKVPVVQTVHNFRFLCPNGLFFCNGAICEQCREQHSFRPALENRCYRKSRVQTAVAVAMLNLHRWLGTYRKISYIFLTEFNKEKFRDLVDIRGENVFIKPNFVSIPEGNPARMAEKPRFLFLGRLDAYKGIDFLLETWPQLPEDYELHIYGDGAYRKACEDAAANNANIHFHGFCPQEVVFEALEQATALLFPSDLYEGFPMSVAESFALGKPVVATNLGNQNDLVQASGGGVTFSPRNKEEFRDAMAEVVANHERYSTRGQQYYRDNLVKTRNYEKLSEIYDKVQHIR